MKKWKKSIKWLLKGDPSIKFQVMRDLQEKKEEEWEETRNLIPTEGWGERLMSRQDEDGNIGGNKNQVYRKWTGTCYTMLLLRRLGFPRDSEDARRSCKVLMKLGKREDGGFNFAKSKSWKGISETCITGMVVSILSYFRYEDDTDRLDAAVDWLLDEQMGDLGWNCRKRKGAHHSSFHTTISVLEGLREYEKAFGDMKDNEKRIERIIKTRGEAIEFLLQHRLYKSDKTGKIVDVKMTKLSFPPRWHYDFIRALDFLREVNWEYDERMQDGLNLIKEKEDSGKWKLEYVYSGNVDFKMERKGKPSHWNTLRCLRVLKKYGSYKKRKREDDEERETKRPKPN